MPSAAGAMTLPNPIGAPRSSQASQRSHDSGEPRELDVAQVIFADLRRVLLQKVGTSGVAALRRALEEVSRNGKIDSAGELLPFMSKFGIRLSEKDLNLLTVAMGDALSIKDFMKEIEGPFSRRRQKLIDMAFAVMDKDNCGRITRDHIVDAYDANFDPDVRAGLVKREEALDQLLSFFDLNHDGTLTRSEFTDYYKGLSAGIEDDDYFELLIRNAWHIPGGQGCAENTSNKRLLVTFAGGEQKVVEVEDDLGLDVKNRAAVLHQLKKQGLKNIVSYKLSGSL